MNSERVLQLTPEVSQRQEVIELAEKASEAVFRDDQDRPSLFYDLLSSYWGRDVEDEYLERAAWRYHKSEFFTQLSATEKALAVRAFSLDDSMFWSHAVLNDGELQREPGSEVAHYPYEQLLLSGAVGAQLVTDFPSLEKYLSKTREPLDQVIELGSLAVIGAQSGRLGRPSVLDSGSYRYTAASRNRSFITRVGADMHGDFRTTRETVPLHGMVDPLGRHQQFGPAELVTVGAYHSDETRILTELLRYELLYRRVDRAALYGRLSNTVATMNLDNFGAGFYADFGDDDGSIERDVLISELEKKDDTHPIRPGSVLCSLIVNPLDRDMLFQVVAQEDGVEFRNFRKDKVIRSFTIAAEEVEMYVTTMLKESHGRTSVESLVNIISALDVRNSSSK